MRILVVQTAFLGDIVLTTPLLREIKRVLPDAHLSVLTTPLGVALLEGHPFVDERIAFDKRAAARGPLGMLRAVRDLRGRAFEAAVAAQRSHRTGLLIAGSGARLRVGFRGASGGWAYTARVPWAADAHAVYRYLALARPFGGNPEAADPRPVLGVDDRARARVTAILAREGIGGGDRIVAISPGSIWGTKRWTPEGFAAVARHAAASGLRPVLVGAPDEAALCAAISAEAGGGIPVLAGATGVQDLTALLAVARALVVNDSGPGHVAAAVGTPVVAVFGPTVPSFGYVPFGPAHRIVERPGLACRPCDRHGPQVCPLGHHHCMTEIPPSRVIAALDDVLREAP
jgi:heptosyltransferase-2